MQALHKKKGIQDEEKKGIPCGFHMNETDVINYSIEACKSVTKNLIGVHCEVPTVALAVMAIFVFFAVITLKNIGWLNEGSTLRKGKQG